MSDTTNPITLTDIAAEQLKEIVQDQAGEGTTYFRIYVAGGGCSGLQYGFAVDADGPEDGDLSFVEKDINMIVDPMSL
ncbi:HesB/IscA family protein, partial [Streptomyces europaeiscabiei]|uniref:HesB/IscA family protein n=1 Tax=Streptomyces europaeiscabiei TaxID=146819 RepID=UPI0038F609C6